MPITQKSFPTSPGVYFFKNADNHILYIGKAKNLQNRLNSYFHSNQIKVIELLKAAHEIDVITTNHEIEALFLEAHLIKQHQPPFNRLLKDGIPYIYIFFSQDKIPTISITKDKKKKGEYFGPFITKKDALAVVEYLKKSLQLSICSKKIKTGCLQYHINICAGSCKDDFDIEFYKSRLNLARQILDSNYKQAIEEISTSIDFHNKNLNFERSQHLVDYKNHLIGLSTALTTLNKSTFTHLKNPDQKEISNITCLSDLKNRLGLSKIPYKIDCFDISHMQSQSIVGSCVRFLNGKPDKKNFRHFNITSITIQNDYAALAEIVARRYKKIENIPDLIIIDGGKGQLHATEHLAPGTAMISIAKGDNRKVGAETIFFRNSEKTISVDLHQACDRLLLEIRDYAHHFAITFHRKKQTLHKK